MFLTSLRLRGAIAAVLIGFGSAASAATLDVSYFDRSDAADAQAALAAFQSGAGLPGHKVKTMRTETFEGYKAWNGASGASNPGATRVGGFTSLGGHGTGSSSVNGGTRLQVRDNNPWVWGRYNTSGVDGNWLDSNDTSGMRWDVGGVGKVNAIAFLLTDVADVGAKFTIKAGDTLFSQTIGAAGKLANGSIQLVRILLPEAVRHIAIELRNNRLNDGFGIDGATVAHIAPVPLPPAALLLISGAAGLAALRRRRAA